MIKLNKKSMLLKLRGKTAVYIDWANVHGWETKLKWEIDLKRLYSYLKSYKQIKEFRFYFGTDTHPASKELLSSARRVGFKVITKPVKYLPVKDKDIILWKRKCDFDLEIGLDAYESIEKFSTFVFFSGDGDFATLYKRLIVRSKKVIAVFARGTLGREIYRLERGIFVCEVGRFKDYIQKISPRRRRGA